MCAYDELVWDCGHITQRLFKYCHFTWNDPDHYHYGVNTINKRHRVSGNCGACNRAAAAAAAARSSGDKRDTT